MTLVRDGRLAFTSGDTVPLTVTLTKNGVEYTMEDSDTLTLTIREKPSDSIILQKTVAGSNNIVLSADETDIDPGRYVFDVKLISGGAEYTVVGLRSIDSRATNLEILQRVSG